MQSPWQNTNWDPAINSSSIGRLCTALGTPDDTTAQTVQGIIVSSTTFNFAKYINGVCAHDAPVLYLH